MKFEPETAATRRPYRQVARAEAAEATAARIRDAFAARLSDSWFEEIRLEDVAREAGVTVQTVIRRFGGKEGLLDAVIQRFDREVSARRESPAGDIPAIVRALIADYEVLGDLTMRMLDQENRYAAVKRFTNSGRAHHRRWLAASFAAWLEDVPPEVARRRLDALVTATDLYVWKLIRRDMQRPVRELQALMERMVQAALSA